MQYTACSKCTCTETKCVLWTYNLAMAWVFPHSGLIFKGRNYTFCLDLLPFACGRLCLVAISMYCYSFKELHKSMFEHAMGPCWRLRLKKKTPLEQRNGALGMVCNTLWTAWLWKRTGEVCTLSCWGIFLSGSETITHHGSALVLSSHTPNSNCGLI